MTFGALNGLRILELGSIGPVPHAAMLMGDMGADVVRVERPAPSPAPRADPTLRARRRIELDMRDAVDRESMLALIAAADVLLEGFRPGVAERMGIGPADAMAGNPRLVYGRLTGWGQDGPLARTPGHDINFLALSGALASFAAAGERPRAPINLVGDYGGGSLYLVVGVLAALWERERSGRGQVVDAAIVDGVSSQLQLVWGLRAADRWHAPGTNLLDGGAPFYDSYECRDGGYVAVGAIEPKFFAELVRTLGWPDAPTVVAAQNDPATWPLLGTRLAASFAERDRDEWAAVFKGVEACVTPVLSLDEAVRHEHGQARQTHVEVGGIVQSAAAPRLSRTPSPPIGPPREPVDVATIVAEWTQSTGPDRPE